MSSYRETNVRTNHTTSGHCDLRWFFLAFGVLQALVQDQLLLDPVPHESAQQQGSLLVAYSVATNQVSVGFWAEAEAGV